jgi:AcrR family transcriptional regulator
MGAALELLKRGGYTAATIEEISARSGVARTTIYRRWPNRAALVVDVLLRLAAETAPPPTDGDPMRALRTELGQVAAAAVELPGRILAALIGEARGDQEVRAALRRGLFDPRRRASGKVVHAAQVSGALRPDVPPMVVLDLLYGPVFYRTLIRQEPATETFVRQMFDAVMNGIGSWGARGPSSKRAAGRRR